MDYLSSFFVALLLCASSAGLIGWYVRAWKRLPDEELNAAERDFRRRQIRRRTQTSAMLGMLGVSILLGQLLLTLRASGLFIGIYWCGVLVFVIWMLLLAMADMVATGAFYRREKNSELIEHARLKGELQRAREKQAPARNGKPGSKK
jgi:hypothetical protein